MSETALTLLAAAPGVLPMGDDTPVLLYVLLGCGALVLLIAATALGKLSAAQKQNKKKKKKKKPQA